MKQENNKGVIQSEIYGVSHGQFVEMKKTNQNNINTNNKTTSTGTNTNKPDNKKKTDALVIENLMELAKKESDCVGDDRKKRRKWRIR